MRLLNKRLWKLSDNHFSQISQIAKDREESLKNFSAKLEEVFPVGSLGNLLFRISLRLNTEPLVQAGSAGSSMVEGETGLKVGKSSKMDAALTTPQMQKHDNVTNSRLNTMLETGNAVFVTSGEY